MGDEPRLSLKLSPSEQVNFAEAMLRTVPAERAAYLDDACRDDPGLRGRLEALLVAAGSCGDFLEVAPGGWTVSAESHGGWGAGFREGSGTRIDRYTLLEAIGEGGCGVVFLAEQDEPVRRRVALKVIKLGMDTRQVIARFEAERQALALMDHANIARVFDAGATSAGRPYFVMELVRGQRITDFCDQHRLDTGQRLALFTRVCQAIQHAHQKGIIHRDLKPSNLLVADHDGEPVPKVIDFGIAKATSDQRLTDKTVFTAMEQFLGTPAYMSPEQAGLRGLDIDTRTDIYSLGVLLYELLTGRTPFDSQALVEAGLDGMRRTICEQEPARPSTRLSMMSAGDLMTAAQHRQVGPPRLIELVRGDLDWIVMKCLEKDRSRRYASASDLALDLQRHLSHEPVLARPPSFGYRAGKWIRKHRGPAIAAAAVLVAVVLGLVVSTTLYLRERRAWSGESAQRAKAELEAAKSAQTARFMTEMLAGIDPVQAKGRDVSVLTEMLERAAGRVDSELTNQPGIEASVRATIGQVYHALALYTKAEPHLKRAHSLQERLLGPGDPDTLTAARQLANLYREQGRLRDAESLYRRARDLALASVGAESWITLELQSDLALAYVNARRFDEAEKLQREALEIGQRCFGPESIRTLKLRASLGYTLVQQRRFADAVVHQTESLDLARLLLPPGHPGVLQEMANLAASLHGSGRLAEAEALYREAWESEQRLYGPEHPQSLISMQNLATLLSAQGRHEEAVALLKKLLEISNRTLGPAHARSVRALHVLSIALSRQGEHDEAEALADKAIAISRTQLGAENPETLRLRVNLADLTTRNPKARARTAALYREALADQRRVLGPAHSDCLLTADNLLRWLRRAKGFDEAVVLSRETLDGVRQSLGSNHLSTITWMNHHAGALEAAGDTAEAEEAYRQSLRIARRTLEPGHAETLRCLRHLGQFAAAAGRWDEALAWWTERSAVETNETQLALAIAATQAWLGQATEHAAFAAQFLRQAEAVKTPIAVERAVKACCLRPSNDRAESARVLHLAKTVLDERSGPGSGLPVQLQGQIQLALGLAEYRNDHLADAEARLRQAEQMAAANRATGVPARFFRSMALLRLGRVNEARELFAEAARQMPAWPADKRRPLEDGAACDQLIQRLACKEASDAFASAGNRPGE